MSDSVTHSVEPVMAGEGGSLASLRSANCVEPEMAVCLDGCMRAVESDEIRRVRIPGGDEVRVLCGDCAMEYV